MSAFDLFKAIDQYNDGLPIPPVRVNDLSIAVKMLRAAHRDFPDLQSSLSTDNIERDCSPGTEPLALATRAFLVDFLLNRAGHPNTAEHEEQILEALAQLELKAADLETPDDIEARVFKRDK